MKKYLFFDFKFKKQKKHNMGRGYTCTLNTETGEITAKETISIESWHDFYKPLRPIVKLSLYDPINIFPFTDDDSIITVARKTFIANGGILPVISGIKERT
jgi:hypothetical protein